MLCIPSICNLPEYGAELIYAANGAQAEKNKQLWNRICKIFKKNHPDLENSLNHDERSGIIAKGKARNTRP